MYFLDKIMLSFVAKKMTHLHSLQNWPHFADNKNTLSLYTKFKQQIMGHQMM